MAGFPLRSNKLRRMHSLLRFNEHRKVMEMSKVCALVCLVLDSTVFLAPVKTYADDSKSPSARVGASELPVYASYQALEVRFEKKESGIVFDRATGLEWFAGPDRDTSWEEAKEWIQNLSVEGDSWRMPTRKELKSLYKQDEGWCNISPLFKTRGHYVWSSEKVGLSHAWGFCFNIGDEFFPRCNYSQAARGFAVRFQPKDQ